LQKSISYDDHLLPGPILTLTGQKASFSLPHTIPQWDPGTLLSTRAIYILFRAAHPLREARPTAICLFSIWQRSLLSLNRQSDNSHHKTQHCLSLWELQGSSSSHSGPQSRPRSTTKLQDRDNHDIQKRVSRVFRPLESFDSHTLYLVKVMATP